MRRQSGALRGLEWRSGAWGPQWGGGGGGFGMITIRGGGGGSPPKPPPPQDQRDHRGKKRNLQLGKSDGAIFGTQTFGSLPPSPPPLKRRPGGGVRGACVTESSVRCTSCGAPPPQDVMQCIARPQMSRRRTRACAKIKWRAPGVQCQTFTPGVFLGFGNHEKSGC